MIRHRPSMQIVSAIGELRSSLDDARDEGRSVGFVATMGYLHAGHRSLMAAARAQSDVVVTSIFVNPLQFAVDEDLGAYPRDFERAAAMCADAGVDIVFAPTVEEMYPEEVLTTVSVDELAARLEGRSRPAHFTGVATVVTKLFSIVGPCVAYFGEKDWQQLTIIRRLVSDLSLPVGVIGCPTIRESDGLALSSRNSYLDDAERAQAIVLRTALDAGLLLLDAGESDASVIEHRMAEVIEGSTLARLDYVAAVSAATLVADGPLRGEVRLLVAARFGRARLIDNDGRQLPTSAP